MRVSTLHLAAALALSLTLASVARADDDPDAVTITSGGSVTSYNGRVDLLSTRMRRVDFSAESGTSGRPVLKAVRPEPVLRDVALTIRAPGGDGYAADGCTLDAVDAMAGSTHVYLTCPD